MSVLVKGMGIPEKCGSCDLFHAEYPMHCSVVKGHKTVGAPYGMPRPEWCPLVELPEKHGRLIDADKLIDYCNDMLRIISESDDDMINIITSRICYAGVIGQIINMATIFEAEGE